MGQTWISDRKGCREQELYRPAFQDLKPSPHPTLFSQVCLKELQPWHPDLCLIPLAIIIHPPTPPCLFFHIKLCGKHRWSCYPRQERKQEERPAVGREIVTAEGRGSQGACTSTPVPLKCPAQVQGAREALLSGAGQNDVNKASNCAVL